MAIKRVTPAEKRAQRLDVALEYVAGKGDVPPKVFADKIGVDSKNVMAYMGVALLCAARDGEVLVRRKKA